MTLFRKLLLFITILFVTITFGLGLLPSILELLMIKFEASGNAYISHFFNLMNQFVLLPILAIYSYLHGKVFENQRAIRMGTRILIAYAILVVAGFYMFAPGEF